MTPEGWYDDPHGEAGYRWWDGSQWTDHTLPPDDDEQVEADESASTPADDDDDAHRPATSSPVTANAAPKGETPWPFERDPAWCRACGSAADQPVGSCAKCGWALDPPAPEAGLVGLVFETKNKLGITRLGLCIAEDDVNVQVHLNPKLTLELPKDSAAVRDLIPAELSAAGRVYQALASKRGGALKAKWDEEYLTELAWSLGCSTTGGMRTLADEATANDWKFIVDALPMSPTELAWRVAHDAASTGDIDTLLDQLRALPTDGYPTRCALVLPHLPAISNSPARDEWVIMLRTWKQAGASSLATVLDRSTDDLAALASAYSDLTPCLPEDSRTRWEEAFASVEARSLAPAPYPDAAQWEAVRHVQGHDAEMPLRLDLLPLTFIDDLIDTARLPTDADRSRLSDSDRHYVISRSDPGSLTMEQLRLVGHHAELARRFYLERDASALHALGGDDPAVDHYRALLEFVDGADSLDRVRSETAAALRLVETAREAIVAGETTLVPDEVASDPSTWITFAELASAGKVASDLNQRASYPAFGNWLDLHQVISLLWAGDWAAAEALARELTERVDDEVVQDEVLSLRAFALHQMGRIGDALSCLEAAMEGTYTEALLVNTGIVAADADAGLATKYFTRLIVEAPSEELQIEAMRFAVQIWMRTPDLVLPAETSDCLYSLLNADLDPGTFLDFVKVAARFDAERIASRPPRTPNDPASRAVHRFYVAKAKMAAGTLPLPEFAGEVVAAGRAARHEPWFEGELSDLIDVASKLMLDNDFGDAVGAAMFTDRIVSELPSLLNRAQYFLLALQAGAHLAATVSAQGEMLNASARDRLVLVPLEEFRLERKDFPEGLANALEENLAMCVHVLLGNTWAAARKQDDHITHEYNSLNQRRQWDTQNAHQLRRRMHDLLDQDQLLIDEVRRVQERCRSFPGGDRQQDLYRRVSDDLDKWQREVVRLKAGL